MVIPSRKFDSSRYIPSWKTWLGIIVVVAVITCRLLILPDGETIPILRLQQLYDTHRLEELEIFSPNKGRIIDVDTPTTITTTTKVMEPTVDGSRMNSQDQHKTIHKAFGQVKVIKEDSLNPKVFWDHPTNYIIDFFTNRPKCTPLSADQVTFTLSTQLSLDRLWIMEEQCKRWPTPLPMSIAIYYPPPPSTPLGHSDSDWVKTILKRLDDEFHCDVSRMNIILFEASTTKENNGYPVNLLRNLALEAIPTTHAVYVDSDFLISSGLHQHLVNTARDILAKDFKALVVIPDFDYISKCKDRTRQDEVQSCLRDEWSTVPGTNEEILELLDHPEKMPHVDRGFQTIRGHNKYHGTTLYRTWAQKNQSTLVSIPCLASRTYEPYVTVRVCQDLPIYPEQFRGWGHNKVVWIKIVLKKLGYRLWQLPQGFVLHIPHVVSSSRQSDAQKTHPEMEEYFHWLQRILEHSESIPNCYDWKKEHGERDP